MQLEALVASFRLAVTLGVHSGHSALRGRGISSGSLDDLLKGAELQGLSPEHRKALRRVFDVAANVVSLDTVCVD